MKLRQISVSILICKMESVAIEILELYIESKNDTVSADLFICSLALFTVKTRRIMLSDI